jgi:phage gp37-like protein
MIAQFEKAVIGRLKTAGEDGLLGYTYRTLETYPEDWGEYFSDEKIAMRPPAAWCTFDGFPNMEEHIDGITRCEALFWLVVAAKNLRNEEATRHGGSGEPGSYQLALDAVGLLQGQTLGLDVDRIQVQRMREVNRTGEIRKRKLSLYAIQMKTALYADPLTIGDGDLAPFEAFHANWDIPPFGNVAVPLPNDADADASDHLTLEGDQS